MHINIWGCLLYTGWIVAYGVYIGVRAAKTIDRSSNIFAYQVNTGPLHMQASCLQASAAPH